MASGPRSMSDLNIASVLQKLEEDEENYSQDPTPIFDFSDDSEREVEVVLLYPMIILMTVSVQEMKQTFLHTLSEDGIDNFDIFFAKNRETFWFSNTLTLPTQKTISKNVIKVFSGPTCVTRDIKSEIDISYIYST